MPTLAEFDAIPIFVFLLVLFFIRKRPKQYKVNRRFLRRYVDDAPRRL